MFVSYVTMMLAWLRLRAGEWDEAERITRDEIERGLGRAAAAREDRARRARGSPGRSRRGANGSPTSASRPTGRASSSGSRRSLELATEWALTTGAPMPVERFEQLAEEVRTRGPHVGWGASRVAAWAAVAGIDVGFEPPAAPPYDGDARARLATGGVRLRRGGVDLRPCADAVADRRRGAAGRGARDRPRARRRAADAAGSRPACAPSASAFRRARARRPAQTPPG